MNDRRAAAGLLFLSGAASLVYQVLWVKQLSLVVGVDVYAVTVGVSAFFAGLAAGSFVFGRRSDRVARPFRLYAAIELGTAVFGVLATILLSGVARPFAVAEAHIGVLSWAIPFGLVAVPAVLMGGTLPVLVRAVGAGMPAERAGRLYAANTAGAIAGTLVAPFVLIPAFGVRGSALAAAGLNVAAALGALALAGSVNREEAAGPPEPLSRDARAAVLLYALAGGLALGYEVVWSQTIVLFTSTRAFAFAVVLATYLAGLALGSALFAGAAGRTRDDWGTFGILIASAGAVAVLTMTALGRWIVYAQTAAEAAVLAWTGIALAGMCTRFFVASAFLVLPPTILLGAAFPAAIRFATRDRRLGRDVGAVVGLNTAGGILGALLTGLVLVPALGLVRTLGALAVAASAVGILSARRGARRRTRVVSGLIAAAVVVAAALASPGRLASLLAETRGGGTVVFHDESPGGTVAVIERGAGASSFRRLYIQGVSNSGDAMPSLRYMRLQALLPLLVHAGEPRSALVVGLGTGITAGALVPYPGLTRRVVAELLPAVVAAAPIFHGNFGAASSPEIEIRLRDGRRELLRSEERYDVITLEPPPPSAAGVVNLFSSDFYRLAASRLAPNGVFAQWWPLPAQNDEDSQSLVRSFLDVFPNASVWTTELHEMLLMGSLSPMPLDTARITTRFEQPAVREALAAVGIDSPAALFATWVTDRAGLERYAGDALPVTDDRPRIEYAPWVRSGEVVRVLPKVLELASEAPLVHADAALRDGISRERKILWAFYEAGISAYEGKRDEWARAMAFVRREDGANPYYRWTVGGRTVGAK
jgi:predicted membrane-bound spermidine synthase